MRTYPIPLALAISLLCPYAYGQTTLDTVFTPPGYEEGPLGGTVYVPASPNGVGVVLVPGTGVSRSFLAGDCAILAAQGYTAMTIDHTPPPPRDDLGLYPKQVRAVKTAVQFMRRNAARFNVTSGRIVGMGYSAGAIYWGESITWDNDYKYFQTDSTVSDHLDAAVLFYGLYDTQKHLDRTDAYSSDTLLNHYFGYDSTLRTTRGNCIANVANITTPVLLLHGTNDGKIEYHQSLQLNDTLLAYGKSSQLVPILGWGHGFRMSTNGVAKDSVLAFLGDLFTGGIGEQTDGLPATYALEQNYPNPFNPRTAVRFQVPGVSDVSIAVYDLLGREVAVLVNERITPGSYEATFDARSLSSGVYIYRMTAGSFAQSRKMLLIR